MAEMFRTTHPDGTVCPDGTRRVPRKFQPCCEAFESRTWSCYYDIRYEWWPRYKSWFNVIPPSAGGGGVAINFCPHCGTQLQARLRSGRYAEL